MAREQLQTLSEPMYYILLALTDECCGVDIMQKVGEISRGRIAVGPGTCYALLDKFLASGLIVQTKAEGRRRSYIITEAGIEMLNREYERLEAMLSEGGAILNKK